MLGHSQEVNNIHVSLLTFQKFFNKSEETYLIFPDATALPPHEWTWTDTHILHEFDVPEGHRLLTRAKGPTGTQGYAVTREGAARLMYQIGFDTVSEPVDLEIMWHCQHRLLRTLEVNPALFGPYSPKGPALKQSDINTAETSPEAELDNRMGTQSVKALMGARFYNKTDIRDMLF